MDPIKKKFDELKPWVTQFTINDKEYGGRVSFDNDIRISSFFHAFPAIRTILDLGSLEGGQTFQLAKMPGISVLGVEGRKNNITKANYVKELLHIQNVEFIYADLEKTSLSSFGKFDAVFCSGILYHLPQPWELMHEISTITSKVFIWTHYASDNKVKETIEGYKGYFYKEGGLNDPLSGLSKKSFWVTRSSLTEMLNNYGFCDIRIYDDSPHHDNGPAIMLAAWKTGLRSLGK
jgi:SAM-dependent methyltransferase